MPMSISRSRPPVITTGPAAPGPVPVPYPNVAQEIEDRETHGDPDEFQPQKEVKRLKEHGTDAADHGNLQPVPFPRFKT
ncbi:MAG: hypothetical protein IT437_00885 [Phycisphaerales bacterium]|nr:hypothetical protein [Phycisphaerales bacterium]